RYVASVIVHRFAAGSDAIPETRVSRGHALHATPRTTLARASEPGRAAGQIAAERAGGAERDRAAVRLAHGDEERVQLVEERRIGRQVRLHELARGLVVRGPRQQPVPRQDAARVGIRDEDGATGGVEQDRVDRFRPEPGHGQQLAAHGAERRATHPLEASAEAREQPRREAAQAPGLEPVRSRRSDRFRDHAMRGGGERGRAERMLGAIIVAQALTLAVSGPTSSPEYLPLRVAEAEGHFAKEGLVVTLKTTRAEPGAAEALAQGQADLVATSLEAMLRFGPRTPKQAPRLVLGLTAAPPVALVVAESQKELVRSLEDLPGTRVGATAPGAPDQAWLACLLARAGLGPAQVCLVGRAAPGLQHAAG